MFVELRDLVGTVQKAKSFESLSPSLVSVLVGKTISSLFPVNNLAHKIWQSLALKLWTKKETLFSFTKERAPRYRPVGHLFLRQIQGPKS